ncbi:hypothetical protein A3K24_00265 [candidate division Kazan bacterium RIFCSPHIGHO2_01_FULL_44_14]|uniref:Uncharacterized protein n=1 Tax=candidate division Kazan bacterium RIFCSPLOWO2_01_FULL_45_19 TaxID=1798538 RepID=A0A1F4NQY4_UNCK3|nr:MAG: hypothetical protein A3K51_00265 [candidate division Kazan bacterium RIFCSPLOWO2_01_FULL_45_19]OGB77547.1 MAG: hypothetical protein A3K24_00265 [candidate division Kazan bacterium RIFCSPHIGHO2_01_FULL_44_14]
MGTKKGTVLVSDVKGEFTDLLAKLGGSNGEDWHKALDRFLRRENPWEHEKLPTWKNIRVPGNHLLSGREFLSHFQELNIKVLHPWPRRVLDDVKTFKRLWHDLHLVRVSARELELPGFYCDVTGRLTRREREDVSADNVASNLVYIRELRQHVPKMGLSPCPPEALLWLRLRYIDQPKGEKLLVWWESKPHELNNLPILENSEGELWIGAFSPNGLEMSEDACINLDQEIVFFKD